MSPGPTTRITVSVIPGYPSVRIQDQPTDRNKTWSNFLRQFSVNLDPAKCVVYNRSRKILDYLDAPIQRMVSRFQRRKGSLSVALVLTKRPILDRTGGPPGSTTPMRRGRGREDGGHRIEARPAPAAAAAATASGAIRSGNRSATAPPSTGQGQVGPSPSRPRYVYPEDSMRIPAMPGQPGNDLPPLLQRQVFNADSDDDNMSQLSQGDDDEEENGDSTIIKQQLVQAVQRLPAVHFLRMKEELMQLKASGQQRDYKWTHYAPRTSAWIVSALGL